MARSRRNLERPDILIRSAAYPISINRGSSTECDNGHGASLDLGLVRRSALHLLTGFATYGHDRFRHCYAGHR